MRQGIAVILREAFQCSTMSQMLAERQKRLRRHELARFYHWKQRKRLAPLNIHKRQFEVSGETVELDILQEWSILSCHDIFPPALCGLQSSGGQRVSTNAMPPDLQDRYRAGDI